MKEKKTLIVKTARVLLMAMFMGILLNMLPTVTFAKELSSAEIKDQIAQLEKEQDAMNEQLKELEKQQNQNLSDLQAIVNQKDVVDKEVTLMNDQISNINKLIAAYGLLIADKQDEMEKAQAELERQRKLHKERIRAMEEGGTLSYWTVLFEASSFSDLLDRMNMIREIASADAKRIDQLDEATKAVESAKIALDAEKKVLAETRKGMEGTKVLLAQKQEESNALLAAMVAKGDEFQKLMDEAEAEADRLVEELMRKEDELSAAEQRELEEWLLSQKLPILPGHEVNGVIWYEPTKYGRISSPFGYRTHPVTGEKGTFHKGVDLTAKRGTPVYATRGGKIVTAERNHKTLGNYIIINHVDGYKSLYAHLDSIADGIKYGARVYNGQPIGEVGSTGRSTGPHLHFAIYYNNEAVNPAKYLGKK